MKNKVLILIMLLFMGNFNVFMAANCNNPIADGQGEGVKLVTLYIFSESEAYKQVGPSKKLLYDNPDPFVSIIKFKVHQNGVELKLEKIEYEIVNEKREITPLETLFKINPKKGEVYSYEGGFPEGAPYHRLTVKYKGREVKYLLDWGLMLVDIGDPDGPLETTEKDLYSGDEGDE